MFTYSLDESKCKKGHAINFSLLVASANKVNQKETTTKKKKKKNTYPFLRFCLNKNISISEIN